MERYNCFVVLFNSTHHALRAEEVLKRLHIAHAVINTPREFSVDCGISLRVSPRDVAQVRESLANAGVEVAACEPYYSRWAGDEAPPEKREAERGG